MDSQALHERVETFIAQMGDSPMGQYTLTSEEAEAFKQAVGEDNYANTLLFESGIFAMLLELPHRKPVLRLTRDELVIWLVKAYGSLEGGTPCWTPEEQAGMARIASLTTPKELRLILYAVIDGLWRSRNREEVTLELLWIGRLGQVLMDVSQLTGQSDKE